MNFSQRLSDLGIDQDKLNQKMEASLSDEDMEGICLSCGFEQGGVEPDAEGDECRECGEQTVYGIENIFMRVVA